MAMEFIAACVKPLTAGPEGVKIIIVKMSFERKFLRLDVGDPAKQRE
jgi:hypothetical protein